MKVKFNQTIIKPAYAKINLFLEVGEKMADGYHEISTVMQTVSLSDVVFLTVGEGDGIEVKVKDNPTLNGENNIVYKAVAYFLEKINFRCHVSVDISKNIPVAAGLGGGSCDAGATLLALNEAFYNILSQSEIEALAKRLGADVPFATRGGCVIACGIGDKMQDISPLDKCFILIIKHGSKKSTKDVYMSLDLIENRKKVDIEPFIKAMESGNISLVANKLYNSFEYVVPISDDVENILKDSFALGYTLCGAGPSVIAIFDNKETAQKTKDKLDSKNIFAYIAEPVSKERVKNYE